MGKNDIIKELTKLLSHAVVHRIGSVVNNKEIYAEKYRKESDGFMKSAKETSVKENWNSYDKAIIKNKLKKGVYDELIKRDFLDKKKFDIMDEEIEKVLSELDLI